MEVETVVQGNTQGKAKVKRSEVTVKVNTQVKVQALDEASVHALDKVIAVTNESQYKQELPRNNIIMQVKKAEITTKSDNTEIEVFKKSKTKAHEQTPKTLKEQVQSYLKPKQEPIEPRGKQKEPSEQPREQP
eukprot:12591549-Ditylum_brightwellii.AAC.1